MKAGVNIWVANRNIKDTHGAWAHLNGKPVRPEDLPRPIDESDPAQVEASAVAMAAAKEQARVRAEAQAEVWARSTAIMKAAKAKAAAAAAAAGGKGVAVGKGGETARPVPPQTPEPTEEAQIHA